MFVQILMLTLIFGVRTPRLSCVEGFNLLDSDVADIDYYYTSRLPGEPAGGVDDTHFHPSLPRTIRVVLNATFQPLVQH